MHLADNDFRAKKQYDELDVVLFDRRGFMDRLKKLEDRDPVTFKPSLAPPKPEDPFEKLQKKIERKKVDEEFTRLVVNRIKKNTNIDHIWRAKEAHRASLQNIDGVDRELGDDILPKSIYQHISKVGDIPEEDSPFARPKLDAAEELEDVEV